MRPRWQEWRIRNRGQCGDYGSYRESLMNAGTYMPNRFQRSEGNQHRGLAIISENGIVMRRYRRP